MNEKEKRIAVLCLVFSVFLFLCTVINLTGGNIGAAVAGFGSGIFYLCISFVLYQKNPKD